MNRNGSIVTRLRESFAARDEARTTMEECPDSGKIWDAANGRLDSEQTRQLVDHFVRCPSCAADWRLAMPPEAKAEPDQVVALTRRPVMRWAALAAALVVVAIVAVFRLSVPTPTEPVYRATDAVIRPIPEEGMVLSRQDPVLRWTAAGSDALYSVEVGKIDLTPIASARDLKETEFRVPVEALEGLQSGETIVWQVEAALPDGRRVASEAFIHRVE